MANEKRLYVMVRVMGELPSGQKLIGIMANNADGIHFFTEDNQLFTVDDILRAADAVPVVRCKDCKRWEQYNACDGTKPHRCMHYDAMFYRRTDPEDFCSYGERKDNA